MIFQSTRFCGWPVYKQCFSLIRRENITQLNNFNVNYSVEILKVLQALLQNEFVPIKHQVLNDNNNN